MFRTNEFAIQVKPVRSERTVKLPKVFNHALECIVVDKATGVNLIWGRKKHQCVNIAGNIWALTEDPIPIFQATYNAFRVDTDGNVDHFIFTPYSKPNGEYRSKMLDSEMYLILDDRCLREVEDSEVSRVPWYEQTGDPEQDAAREAVYCQFDEEDAAMDEVIKLFNPLITVQRSDIDALKETMNKLEEDEEARAMNEEAAAIDEVLRARYPMKDLVQ